MAKENNVFEPVVAKTKYVFSKEKNVEDVRKENVDTILKFTEQLANSNVSLPKDVLENINKSIERKHNRVPLSSFQEAGVVTDNYVYSKVMEEEQSVGQALCAMRDEKLMDGWFPDNPRGFYASVATDVLGLDMSPTYPPNAIHNVLSHSDNQSFAIPTKEGAIVQVDISHIIGKEAYFMYNIKDKELVDAKTPRDFRDVFYKKYESRIYNEHVKKLLKAVTDKFDDVLMKRLKSHDKVYRYIVKNNKDLFKDCPVNEKYFFTKESANKYLAEQNDYVRKSFGNRYYDCSFKDGVEKGEYAFLVNKFVSNRNLYDELTKSQQGLVSIGEKYAKDNNIVDENGKPFKFNRKGDNARDEMNVFVNTLKEHGFVILPPTKKEPQAEKGQAHDDLEK